MVLKLIIFFQSISSCMGIQPNFEVYSNSTITHSFSEAEKYY